MGGILSLSYVGHVLYRGVTTWSDSTLINPTKASWTVLIDPSTTNISTTELADKYRSNLLGADFDY